VADTEADHCGGGEMVDMWEVLIRFGVFRRVSCPRENLGTEFCGVSQEYRAR
jgi:hypothetical protein